jgi:hypothetical protein
VPGRLTLAADSLEGLSRIVAIDRKHHSLSVTKNST